MCLVRHLGRGVRVALARAGVGLGYRPAGVGAAVVDAVGTHVYEALDAGEPRRLQHVDGALYVDLHAGVDRAADAVADEPRRVDDDLRLVLLHRRHERGQVAQVALHGLVRPAVEFHAQVVRVGPHVVEDDGVSLRDGLTRVRSADESRSGNEAGHGSLLFPRYGALSLWEGAGVRVLPLSLQGEGVGVRVPGGGKARNVPAPGRHSARAASASVTVSSSRP